MFIVGLFIGVTFIFSEIFRSCLIKCNIIQEEEPLEVDEKVGSYYECVSVADRKRWYAEELHMSKDLGI